MKIKPIIFILIFLNIKLIYANELKLFQIDNKVYTNKTKIYPNYDYSKNTYDKNIKNIINFFHNELFIKYVIIPSKIYKKLNIDKKIKKWEKYNNKKADKSIKQAILIHFWKEATLKSYKISEENIINYYKKHPKEFIIPESISAYFLLCKNKKDCEKVRKELLYSNDVYSIIYKESIKRNQGQTAYLGYRTSKEFKEFGNSEEIFDYLNSLKPGEFTNKQIKIQTINKYVIFYLKGKQPSFKEDLKLAKPQIIKELKDKIFNIEIEEHATDLYNKKPIYFIKNIRKISKK